MLKELIYCLECKQYVTHRIECQVKTAEKQIENKVEQNDNSSNLSTGFFDDLGIYNIQVFSQIISCGICKCTSLRNVEINKYSEIPDNIDIFPKRPTIEPKLKTILPKDIFGLYLEALFALENSYNFSCGASIRTLIELICKDRKHKDAVIEDITPEFIKEANEREVIKELKKKYSAEIDLIKSSSKSLENLSQEEQKKIEIRAGLGKQVKKLTSEIKSRRPKSKNDFDVLSKVVEWGNNNIHDYQVPSKTELEDVINIINFLFHVLYIDEHEESKFEKSDQNFKKNRR